MSQIPTTSVTLLKALASETASARWTEFFRRYEGPMRTFLASRYPSVEADDVMQETLIALTRRMPGYHYTPDRNGHFRNYLMGIVKHKAEDVIRRQMREHDRAGRLKRHSDVPDEPADEWKFAAMNAALEQLLSDSSVNARTREVFRHVAVMHETPESVAAQFGLTVNNVYQIRSRLVNRLAKFVSAMTDDA